MLQCASYEWDIVKGSQLSKYRTLIVLQCVALLCCSVLQCRVACVAVCTIRMGHCEGVPAIHVPHHHCVVVCCSVVLQCVAVLYCSVLQCCVAVCCSVLQCVPYERNTVNGSQISMSCTFIVLQCVAVCCVAVCCSVVLQCVAGCCSVHNMNDSLWMGPIYPCTAPYGGVLAYIYEPCHISMSHVTYE